MLAKYGEWVSYSYYWVASYCKGDILLHCVVLVLHMEEDIAAHHHCHYVHHHVHIHTVEEDQGQVQGDNSPVPRDDILHHDYNAPHVLVLVHLVHAHNVNVWQELPAFHLLDYHNTSIDSHRHVLEHDHALILVEQVAVAQFQFLLQHLLLDVRVHAYLYLQLYPLHLLHIHTQDVDLDLDLDQVQVCDRMVVVHPVVSSGEDMYFHSSVDDRDNVLAAASAAADVHDADGRVQRETEIADGHIPEDLDLDLVAWTWTWNELLHNAAVLVLVVAAVVDERQVDHRQE